MLYLHRIPNLRIKVVGIPSRSEFHANTTKMNSSSAGYWSVSSQVHVCEINQVISHKTVIYRTYQSKPNLARVNNIKIKNTEVSNQYKKESSI